MAPTSGNTIRPLIETSREEVERYLEGRGQAWRTDATNADVKLTRNRMRHVTIPQLARDFNPQLSSALERTIEVLQQEDQWMRIQSEDWLAEHGLGLEPASNIDFGTSILRSCLDRFPAQPRTALSAYSKATGTTEGDYALDILSKQEYFRRFFD